MKAKSGRTTIKDVAREAGVSTALVSMVINARVRNDGTLDCPVNHLTAERIQSVVRRLNYRPNKAAASLRNGRRRTIGVICPDMARHYFAEISRHIENNAYRNGYTVLFGSSDDRVQKLGDLVSTFIADGVDGMLITPCMDCHSHIQRAVDLGIPVVLMTRDLPGQDNVGKVLLDNRKAIQMALGHLYSRGYRRIEMMSTTSALSILTHREMLYMSEMDPTGGKENDHAFVVKLLRTAYNGYEKYISMISEVTPKWDRSRICSTDLALIICGLAEAEAFDNIAPKVTINEFVEISKYYSTPESRAFVNGILDKLIKK